jgi:hypothetical protein
MPQLFDKPVLRSTVGLTCRPEGENLSLTPVSRLLALSTRYPGSNPPSAGRLVSICCLIFAVYGWSSSQIIPILVSTLFFFGCLGKQTVVEFINVWDYFSITPSFRSSAHALPCRPAEDVSIITLTAFLHNLCGKLPYRSAELTAKPPASRSLSPP